MSRTEAILTILREASGTKAPKELRDALQAAGRTDNLRLITATLDAVRVVSQSTGEGLYPAGTAMVTWMVDLSAGNDDPATLFVNAVDIFDDVDFDSAVTTMDRMGAQPGGHGPLTRPAIHAD